MQWGGITAKTPIRCLWSEAQDRLFDRSSGDPQPTSAIGRERESRVLSSSRTRLLPWLLSHQPELLLDAQDDSGGTRDPGPADLWWKDTDGQRRRRDISMQIDPETHGWHVDSANDTNPRSDRN